VKIETNVIHLKLEGPSLNQNIVPKFALFAGNPFDFGNGLRLSSMPALSVAGLRRLRAGRVREGGEVDPALKGFC
jgi:hypothetical protein